VIYTHEFQQIRQRKLSSSSNFEQLAAKVRSLNHRVKQEWNNLCAEDKENLKEFAYDWIEPPKSGVFNLKNEIWTIVYFLFLRVTNQKEAFRACIKALDTFSEDILDFAAREEASYKAVLSDTLEQLYSGAVQSKELKPEETRGWLRSISDSAIGEV
jgi:hypothetical protein